MSCSKLIKRLRNELNLSQENLARELDVSFATINRWERGKVNPSKMAMKAIENYCKLHGLSDILDGGDNYEN